MEKIILHVKNREIGKKNLKLIKKNMAIPAVVYGNINNNKNITIDYNTFFKIFKKAGTNTIIDLIDEKNIKIPTIIRSVDFHPVTNKITHVDFFAVRMDSEIDTTVGISIVGESDAIKLQNGILIHNLSKIDIRCMPADLIHTIEVDISSIKEVGESIYVKDLKVPSKIKIMNDPEEIVLSIVAQEEETEEAVTSNISDTSESTKEENKEIKEDKDK